MLQEFVPLGSEEEVHSFEGRITTGMLIYRAYIDAQRLVCIYMLQKTNKTLNFLARLVSKATLLFGWRGVKETSWTQTGPQGYTVMIRKSTLNSTSL
jgi:hypothetical protein